MLLNRVVDPRRLVAPLAALALVAAPSHAQTCEGTVSFRAAPLQLRANARFGDDIGLLTSRTAVNGGLAFAGSSGAYLGFTAGVSSFSDLDRTAADIGAFGGIPLRAGLRTQICPRAELEYIAGPNDVGAIDYSTWRIGAGFSIGSPVVASPDLVVVPTGGLMIVHNALRASTRGGSSTTGRDGGILRLGAGLVFTNQFSVTPAVDIPLGFDGAGTAFVLGFALRLGGR